jgi:hypothetical protein
MPWIETLPRGILHANSLDSTLSQFKVDVLHLLGGDRIANNPLLRQRSDEETRNHGE